MHLNVEEELRRSDEPGAWYAMLPLEVVYAFDPVPPEPQHEEPPTPMSRSGDGDSDGSGMDVEASSNGMGDGGGVSHTPAYADWTLPAKDAHHIIGGQARFQRQNTFGLPPFAGLRSGSMRALPCVDACSQHLSVCQSISSLQEAPLGLQ